VARCVRERPGYLIPLAERPPPTRKRFPTNKPFWTKS
jgi:hypothetical protein